MEMVEFTERILRPNGRKFWLSVKSGEQYGGQWMNCLYLHFAKEDFPMLKSPPLVDCDWYGKKGKRFDYGESPLNEIEFHGGITFYEETYLPEAERTIVKVGCDYQHWGDDHYRARDYGRDLIESDALSVMKDFEALIERLTDSDSSANTKEAK